MAETSKVEPLPEAIQNQIKATIYGQCIGDALGLLTEFMVKREAQTYYGKKPKDLRYDQKVPDFHRCRWEAGDWTDDSDQMILILQSLLYNKGEVKPVDFAKRMRHWMLNGFAELGDHGGNGIGNTTLKVLSHQQFIEDPQKVAKEWWEKTGCKMAANGAVMRTSILGIHQWKDIEIVKENALSICTSTHFDPRCQASVIAVTSSIALMLKHTQEKLENPKAKNLDVDDLIKQCFEIACQVLETKEQKDELWKHMSCKKLKDLKLCEAEKIGYTYKCMGSGFWALKQTDFKKALIKLVMEAGDADTNTCVAGAMLGCKLGLAAIPQELISGLKHKDFIDDLYERFIKLQSEMSLSLEERCDDNEYLCVEKVQERCKKIREEEEKRWNEARMKKEEEDKKKEET